MTTGLTFHQNFRTFSLNSVQSMLPDSPVMGHNHPAAEFSSGVAEVSCGDVPDSGSPRSPEDAGKGLRSATVITYDPARAIGTLGEELAAGHAADQAGQNSPDFNVHVEGTSRDLSRLVRDEVHRIAGEALRNAFRHAQAGRIEVEIRYDRRELRLRVRDNGKGIDPKVLDGGGCSGHYGLPGMHERARLVGGKLAVWSELDSGTEAELTIPGSVAYAKSPVARRRKFAGKGT